MPENQVFGRAEGGAMACVRKATLLPLDNADEIKVCVIRLE